MARTIITKKNQKATGNKESQENAHAAKPKRRGGFKPGGELSAAIK